MSLPNPRIVDTNVAIVANGGADQASDEMAEACIDALVEVTRSGGLILDNEDRIFREYTRNLSLAGMPGTGDLFMKWVHDHRWNPELCELRSLTCTNEVEQLFVEFPCHPALVDFDVSDRKFIATSNAGSVKPAILQAVDFKWLGWRDALESVGIHVHFLIESEAEEGFRQHQQNGQ